jgi:nucleoside-diphosphate-sugar epimerase
MDGFQSEAELEDFLSRPSPEDIAAVQSLGGDFLVLGAGGKMGPTLTLRIQRAISAAGTSQQVHAASRFSEARVGALLENAGVHLHSLDLLDWSALTALPRAENVIFATGRKFGSSGQASLTWAMNVLLPGHIVDYFRHSRIAALSSGNIYPFVPLSSGGCTEDHPIGPVGEYAQSILGRERAFEYGADSLGARVINLRLNYAIEPRYGILADIGLKVWSGQPIDVTMPAVNFIWQGDANSFVLRSLPLAASPAALLNIAGPDIVLVRDIAIAFSDHWGVPVAFTGHEAATALLNNGARAHALLGKPTVSWSQMLTWTANWISAGGRSLGKPTHFEARDGKF